MNAPQFVLRIQSWQPGNFTHVTWEETESIQQAESRAKRVREMGASVEIYRLL
jgi:hypothetical protein